MGTRELLGVCGFYKAAFPNGHAEADLSKPFFDYLPELSELGTEATLSTEDFITELYEPQQAFCQSNSETVDAVVAQLLSGEKLSAENQELLDLTLLEMVVVADEIESEDDRRNLALVYFGCLLGFIAIVVLIGLVEVALTTAGAGLGVHLPHPPTPTLLNLLRPAPAATPCSDFSARRKQAPWLPAGRCLSPKPPSLSKAF